MHVVSRIEETQADYVQQAPDLDFPLCAQRVQRRNDLWSLHESWDP
jgi:hypothetical protein